MNELLHVYLSAWPTVWVMDTARYLVAATLMASILALFWRAGLGRRKLQSRDPVRGQRKPRALEPGAGGPPARGRRRSDPGPSGRRERAG